ncbi:adhesion G protein-coupled receptor G3-like [Hemiscyllium ocellatum]|uniref:adhesion G protein-coupled receptor G3-like n=1 Tax=Hemiscyllium ocellatum TaxID=170820 RepID=UPI002966AA7F|nr:adhesion G protein-coupled receptor G3-like [Hemiscyllium ocellatum]
MIQGILSGILIITNILQTRTNPDTCSAEDYWALPGQFRTLLQDINGLFERMGASQCHVHMCKVPIWSHGPYHEEVILLIINQSLLCQDNGHSWHRGLPQNECVSIGARIMGMYLKDTLPVVKNQTVLNRVVGIEVGNRAFDNLLDPVRIVFTKSSPVKAIPKCVFWELKQNGNTAEGHWNDSGCTTQNTVNEVICQCNHLTFFAVLLQIDGNQHLDEKTLRSLTYITQIGCGVSGIFTAITLIIHFILRKRQKEASIQIHVNLSAALFLLNVSFLTSTVFSSKSTDELCKAIAALLHYSLLCSFTWMGIEAFHLYLMLIKVFNIYIRFYMLKLCLLGWGLPAGVLLIIIGVCSDNYGQYSILLDGDHAPTSM